MFPLLHAMFDSLTLAAQLGDLTWTPATFYIAAGVVQIVLILLSFRLLQLDPEYNTFVGAAMAAVISNGIAFVLKDFGLFGVLGTGATFFAMLVIIAHVDVLKAGAVWLVVIASYFVLAQFVLPRSDMRVEQLGGIPQVLVQGGLEAEPFTQDSVDSLSRGQKP